MPDDVLLLPSAQIHLFFCVKRHCFLKSEEEQGLLGSPDKRRGAEEEISAKFSCTFALNKELLLKAFLLTGPSSKIN